MITGLLYLFINNEASISAPVETHNKPSIQAPIEEPYSATLSTTYITNAETTWPPQVVFTKGEFVCIETGEVVSQNGKTIQKRINDIPYCVTQAAEGAAGSTYTTYTYMREVTKGELATVSFTLRSVQCMNYDNPKQSQCLSEQASFDPDRLAHALIINTQ